MMWGTVLASQPSESIPTEITFCTRTGLARRLPRFSLCGGFVFPDHRDAFFLEQMLDECEAF